MHTHTHALTHDSIADFKPFSLDDLPNQRRPIVLISGSLSDTKHFFFIIADNILNLCLKIHLCYDGFILSNFPISLFPLVSQVMLAASYWSLLAPAIGMAEDSGKYGSFAFVPVAVGFTLGAAFVYFADLAMPLLVGNLSHTQCILQGRVCVCV